MKLASINALHSREVSRRIVENFNALNFMAFRSVNCLYFWGFFLNVWASTGLQFLILYLDLLIQLCLFADVHNLKQDCN